MKWQPGDDRYVEDRRGMSIGGRGVPMGIGGVLVLLVLSWLTGTDLLSLLGPATEQGGGQTVQRPVDPAQEPLAQMAGALLTDLNQTWARTLGDRYQPTTVVLFTDRVNAEGCGIAGSATGPFYCPATRKVYIDLGFYRELEERFGAPGDFAQESDPQQANALSVRMELQADCFAGVWGHAASQGGGRVELESGDVDEGLRAAAAIGDDR